MMTRKRKVLEAIKPLFDKVSVPLTVGSAGYMKFLRRIGMEEMPTTINLWKTFGIYPIQNHYYEPLFDDGLLHRPLGQKRSLPGLDLNLEIQLEWLSKLSHISEITDIPYEGEQGSLHRKNGTFQPGDIDALYGMLRLLKPKRYVEIGSGNSTLVALRAVAQNAAEGMPCEVTCVEPFEMQWLERTEARVIRERVELLDTSLVQEMESGDVLFIDSSHMIRPQGDVLFIFQELIPAVPPGVIIHIHDIFTPRDYPEKWIVKKRLFWNEQYLLESFLTFNDEFEVLLATNMLCHDHFSEIVKVFDLLAQDPNSFRPTSFWIRRKEE